MSRTAWPSSRSLQDQLLDPRGLLHAERGRRLVHDDELGAEARGPADRHGLALAAGLSLRTREVTAGR
jgi:hypothetical protein